MTPSCTGSGERRGWQLGVGSTGEFVYIPYQVTFNPAARALQQYPIEELAALRGAAMYDVSGLALKAGTVSPLGLAAGAARTSEVVATFVLPGSPATFGLRIGGLDCNVSFTPPPETKASVPLWAVPVACGELRDSLPLLGSEEILEIRIFIDVTFVEVFFARGRVAFTAALAVGRTADVSVTTTADLTAERLVAYPIRSPWVTPEAVRTQRRVFG